MTNRVAFTIAANNRLPSALICKETFRKYHPDIDFVIFSADRISEKNDLSLYAECQPIINCYELKQLPFFQEGNALEEMAYKFDVLEFCTAIKPSCIQYLFWCGGYDQVCYFDPDIMFFDSVYATFSCLNDVDCVLTPHVINPMPNDGREPKTGNLIATGVYNLGFVGFSLSQKVINFLLWWQHQLKNYGFVAIEHNMFVDQLWMNFAPCFLNTYISKHMGENVAYWNLHERELTLRNNRWFANLFPLKFFHFSGLDYNDKKILSRHQNRYKLETRPDNVQMIFDLYRKLLRKKNASLIAHKPYYFVVDGNKRDYVEVLTENVNPWVNKQGDIGINVGGYFSAITGVGKTARDFVRKIYSTGIPYCLKPIQSYHKHIPLDEEREFGIYYTDTLKFDTSVLFVNLDQLHSLKEYSPSLFDKKTICMPAWETEGEIPYIENIELVDGVIAYTDFTYNLFKPYTKVFRMKYPIIMPKDGDYDKRVPDKNNDDKFIFYFNFDYCSAYERKNPEAIIKALSLISKEYPQAHLLIKTAHGRRFPTESTRLAQYPEELGIRDKVSIIDIEFSERDNLSWLNQKCDCYISLHKSEGIGLGVVQAMCLGKPVISTNYSGTLEFTKQHNSLLVKYDKVQLDKDVFKVYKKGSYWAEPNIEDAAEKMRMIVADKNLRSHLSLQAKQYMIEYSNMANWNNRLYELMENDFEK